MSLNVEDLPDLWIAYSNRWSERDDRWQTTHMVVNGDWGLVADDGLEVDNRSPNLIQVGIEDTAEAAAFPPTPMVDAAGTSEAQKDAAIEMQRMAVSYLDRSQMDLLGVSNMMDLVAYGMFVNVAVMDEKLGTPYLQRRNPRNVYPEPSWEPFASPKQVIAAQVVYVTQMPEEWQKKFWEHDNTPVKGSASIYSRDIAVTLVEYWDEDEYFIGALYSNDKSATSTGSTRAYTPVELHRENHSQIGCPVFVGQRMTLDSEPRGQFDQAIAPMAAHIRLMGTMLDYSDQAVYSDVWVKDLIGEMSTGGGGYIQLGPQGAIGRVAPAVTSLSVFEQLQQLMDSVHLAGRWPKSRPGDIEQAIASGKFLETSAAMMNTVLKTLHLINKRTMEEALSVLFKMDHAYGKDRMITGVLSNQKFQTERKKSDIDLEARVRVEYGPALGKDQASATVMGIQLSQAGLVSNQFVQENMDGLTDVARERARIDVEQMRQMAFAKIMQGLETGEVPMEALSEIAKAREGGAGIFELVDEFLVAPQKELEEQMIPSGLGGPPMMPGAPPGAEGPTPPAPPGAAELLGGGGPGGPPPGEGELSTIGRTSVPLGGGSFAGVESRG